MLKQIETAQAYAIVSATRAPGFHYAMRMLEDLAQQLKDRAFNSEDEARAVRLVHEGRGAAQIVREFKAALATLEESVRQPNPESPDWREGNNG